jgi:hypothetical protein
MMDAPRLERAPLPSIEWPPASDDQNCVHLASCRRYITDGGRVQQECRLTYRPVSNRYAALLLLLVPWLILEPIKPIGFLLFSHKHHLAATLLIAGGEVVKLTLFEQLFDMTKPKLLTFQWFAWSYSRWRAAIEYLRSLPPWRRMRDWYGTVRAWARRRWLIL